MVITSLVGQQDPPPHSDALAGDTGHLIVDGRARKCWGDWFVGGACRLIFYFVANRRAR